MNQNNSQKPSEKLTIRFYSGEMKESIRPLHSSLKTFAIVCGMNAWPRVVGWLEDFRI